MRLVALSSGFQHQRHHRVKGNSVVNFIQSALCLFICILVSLPLNIDAEVAASSEQQDLDEVVLQLKWIHQFNFAGYYAAIEQGYYADAGLEVIIREGKPGINFIEEVVSGRAQYGIEMPELLIAHHQGEPVVVLAAIFQHSPQILLARADHHINSPHDLVGKKVMWRFDSAAELRAMISNENVPLTKIEFTELSWDINDLINGEVDALHAYITDQPLTLEKAGVEYTELSPIHYGIDFYGDCLFTSKEELSAHPDRVRAFREASLRGWAYAMEHPEELMDVISNTYHSVSTRPQLEHEYEHINDLMFPKLVDIGHMNPGRWKHIGDTFVDLAMLDPDYSLDGFLYDPQAQHDNSKILLMFWILLGVFTSISMVLIGLLIFNRKLKREVDLRTGYLSSEIKEREVAERELQDSNARHAAMIENIGDVIGVIGLDGHTIYQSPNVEKWFGWKPEELQGDGWRFMHPDDIARIQAEFKALLSGSVPSTVEYRFRCKDGSYKWIELSAVNRSDDPLISGVLINYHDISQRKLAEEELRRHQDHLEDLVAKRTAELQEQNYELTEQRKVVEEANRLKSEFLSNMSHELRTPLNSIISLSNILAIQAKDKLLKEHNEYLEIIERNGKKLLELINEILDLSKIEAGKTQVNLSEVSLSLVLGTIKDDLSVLADEKGLRVHLNSPEKLPHVSSDESKLYQVFTNVLGNAIKFTPSGAIDLIITPHSNHVDVDIKDTGIGISEEVLPYIFEEFRQVDGSFSRRFDGAGLGLSIAYKTLKLIGGSIKVKSKLGEGSVFTISIPIEWSGKPSIAARPSRTAQKVTHKKVATNRDIPTVHVVEDNPDNMISIKAILKDKFDILESTDGASGLKLASEQLPDLILLDMILPEMAGTEVVKSLKSNKKTRDIPVIAITASVLKHNKESYFEAGCDDLVAKPIDYKLLLKTMEKWLNH